MVNDFLPNGNALCKTELQQRRVVIRCFDSGIMKCVLLVCAFVACTSAVAGQDLGVSDAMAARVDAQAWRVDRLTKQFQTISDLADDARAAAKAGGDTARHLMSTYMSGKAIVVDAQYGHRSN